MASDIPQQFAGHQFAGKPPSDETCEWCGISYGDALRAHAAGGISVSMCPHFGPKAPAARAAFLAQQAERNRLANLAHGAPRLE